MFATLKKPLSNAPTNLADPSNPVNFASFGPGSRTAQATAAAPAGSVAVDLQGDGDYRAARIFNGAERKFVASGKVNAAARAAAHRTGAERLELLAAEKEGASRSKAGGPVVAGAQSVPARQELPAKGAYQDRG